MKWFFKEAQKKARKIAELKNINKKDLVYHALPHFLGEVMSKYFRVEVEGVDNIPSEGSAIIASNHSGYSGLDAFLLCHHIYDKAKRTPRVLAHHLWFLTPATAIPARKLGFIEAKSENGIKTLHNDHLLLVFPEGENGNFKPTTDRYRLQPYKAGLIRMALETGAPIIPTIVIGAEEAHINLAKLKFSKYLKGLILPLPLNIIPLPSKWKIKFLPPFKLKYGIDVIYNEEKVQEICKELQEHTQKEINKELKKRKTVFI